MLLVLVMVIWDINDDLFCVVDILIFCKILEKK